MTQLPLSRLRTFAAAVEAMSFSGAARAVHKSPATVSMQIAQLESALGAALFDRDTRNLHLTPAGEQLIGYARRILRLHDEAVHAVSARAVDGCVTIGVPDDYIVSVLPPALRRFDSLFPRVELTVVCAQSTALVPALAAGEIDLAILTRSPGTPGEHLCHEPMVWVACHNSAALSRSPLPVALFEPHSSAREAVVGALDASGVDYRAAYSSFSQMGMLAIVDAGLAVAAVVGSAAPAHLQTLGAEHGLPPLPRLEVVLARGPNGHSPPCDALAQTLLASRQAAARTG